MSLTIEMSDPEGTIMQEIADRSATQRSVAITYAFLIAQDEGKTADWPTINSAIKARWKGRTALERIKKLAWKTVQNWEEEE